MPYSPQYPTLTIEDALPAVAALIGAQQGKAHQMVCPIALHGAPGVGKSVVAMGRAGAAEIVRARPILAAGGGAALRERCAALDPSRPAVVLIQGAAELAQRHPEAVRSLLEDHCAGGADLHDGAVVVATDSSPDPFAFLPALGTAILLRVYNDPRLWCDWAMAERLDPTLVGFLLTHPDLLYGDLRDDAPRGVLPSPARWHRLSAILTHTRPSSNPHLSLDVALGLVGERAANELFGFFQLVANLPRPAQLAALAKGAPLPRPLADNPRLALPMAAQIAAHAVDDTTAAEAVRALERLSAGSKLSGEVAILCTRWLMNLRVPVDIFMAEAPDLLKSFRGVL